ncbi:MAG: Eco57I restriction-modification methylase domain-containing protein [Promethearchaeota archaeon]
MERLERQFHADAWRLRLAFFSSFRTEIPVAYRLEKSQELFNLFLLLQLCVERGFLGTEEGGLNPSDGLISLVGELKSWITLRAGSWRVHIPLGAIRSILEDLGAWGALAEYIALVDPTRGFPWEELGDFFGSYRWDGLLSSRLVGQDAEIFVNSTQNERTRVLLESTAGKNLRGLPSTLRALTSGRGNKRLGAFYTPEDVASYLAGLVVELSGGSDLLELKVLDPAVGSGHLLTAVAEAFFQSLREPRGGQLEEKNADPLRLKAKILSNLYGVDILPSAVYTCRSRLYTWLLEDAENPPENLEVPTLSRQIKTGNALIGTRDLKTRAVTRVVDGRESFNWPSEFPGIFKTAGDGGESGGVGAGPGFDIVIGNPPYGNILSGEEKTRLGEMGLSMQRHRQIAWSFLELEFQLVRRGGVLVNILPGALAANKKASAVRDLVQRGMSRAYLAYFGTRPSKIFPGLEIRTSILFGVVDRPAVPGNIWSTESIKFAGEDRKTLFQNLSFEDTSGLYLGDRLGVRREGETYYFPRVGKPRIRRVLQVLREHKGCLGDLNSRIVANGDEFHLWRHKTVGYWIIALLSTGCLLNENEWVCEVYGQEYFRDFAFLALNSSLFYLFWSTYSDLFHLNAGLLAKFPIPPAAVIENQRDELSTLARRVDGCIQAHFRPRAGRNGEFDMKACRPALDEVDDTLGELYGIPGELTEFVKKYDEFIR